MAMMGLDDDVRDAPPDGVDDDVSQLAEYAIGAVDGPAELEPHDQDASWFRPPAADFLSSSRR